jgi:DNA-binding MarR family transcriptional regulator
LESLHCPCKLHYQLYRRGSVGHFFQTMKEQDEFLKVAQELVVYRLRYAWLELSRLFNAEAAKYTGTMSMGFILLTINDEYGTPVTRIAPRMGMEPNSLSRILKSMEERGFVFRRRSKSDKRKVYICLTDEGRKKRDIALETVYKMEEAITKDIPARKLKAFFEVMDHIPGAVERFEESKEE